MRLPSLALVFALPGCFAEGYSMKDRVTEAARLYNDGVRWNKVDQAVPYLPKDQRQPFVERMAALVPDEAVDVFTITGDVATCRRRVREYRDAGLDEIVLALVGTQEDRMRSLGQIPEIMAA